MSQGSSHLKYLWTSSQISITKSLGLIGLTVAMMLIYWKLVTILAIRPSTMIPDTTTFLKDQLLVLLEVIWHCFCSTRTIVQYGCWLQVERWTCLSVCLFVLGKFKDDYWSSCGPMRNKAKVAGNLAQLLCTVQSTQTVGTVKQEYWHKHRHCSRLLSGDDWQWSIGTSIDIAVSQLQTVDSLKMKILESCSELCQTQD